MSAYIDLKFINLIGHRLDRFKRKDDYLFNFRCPICGDSQRKKSKARGYLYKVKNDMFFKCHNCDAGLSFGNLLKQVDPLLYKEYVLERYKEGVASNKPHKKAEFEHNFVPEFKPKSLVDELMDRLDSLPDDHEAVQYAMKRMIPAEQFSRIYFLDDIRKASQLNSKYKESLTTEQPRMVLPFVNAEGKLTGMAMRGMRGEALRYITLKIDEDAPTIFGLDAIDKTQQVKVVEGPIDSLFISNSIACAGSSFNRIEELYLDDPIIIFDNQPRNTEVCKLIKKYIDLGYSVCIWPESLEEKDINDIILSGKTQSDVEEIISNNTFKGLSAELKYRNWRKC